MTNAPKSKRLHTSPNKSFDYAEQDSARLRALFASIGEGVIAVDSRGLINQINSTALRILGRDKREVIHKHFLSVVQSVHENGQAIDVYERPMVRAIQTGKTISARTLYVQKDGSLVPVHITVSPVILLGKPVGAIEVLRDLTTEIENDKLKSDFISIASHQLRTPLSAINMYTRMLQDGLAGELSPAQLPYLKTILTSVERMNNLIDTLLNITRIESGGITIRPRAVALNEITQEILEEFLPMATAKNLTVTADIPETIDLVWTDNLLVREVCANLLSNAIKYTPDGGAVHIMLQDERKEVRWTVSDNGYGIPASDQKNIFLKFFRAHNITRKDVSGTGLGLYLIKNIAEQLGGDLWFESTEDVGSHFYFSLPKVGVVPTESTDSNE